MELLRMQVVHINIDHIGHHMIDVKTCHNKKHNRPNEAEDNCQYDHKTGSPEASFK